MKLTFDKAIEEHRKLWNWMADKTLEYKRRVYKDEYFFKDEEYDTVDIIYNDCFCCEYANQVAKSLGEYDVRSCACKYCPVIWNHKYPSEDCEGSYSPYYLYDAANLIYTDNDWKDLAELCREIANLPAREKQDYDL